MLVALALNVAALAIPFLDLRRVFSSDTYSLPYSVALLWQSGLYVLAAVIVAFSICFPFAKLAILAAIVIGVVPPRRRAAWLAFVERYGKWSMVDVFIVCLMIALANDQLFVDAEPRIGILCFTCAIVVSMVCSAWMQATLKRGHARTEPSRPTRTLVVGQVVLIALVSAVLFVPFLRIDDWLLVDRPISILVSIVGLWETGSRTLAVVIGFFLAFAPLASAVISLAVLLRARKQRSVAALRRVAHLLHPWEMLDVFALALGIFLIEGRSFVRTELEWGAFLLALLLALYWPASLVQRRRLEG